MSSPAIRVEGLGKRYTLGRRVDPYRTLGETVAESVGRWRAALRRGAGWASAEEFWALRDVSFEVAHGEAIGIVGGNGAGKSTLLKVLSRITTPTTGRARIQGRLGSLLEVGTGFHPDLTGRENVFLNGAILGMRRAEIVARFDEIVAFAEVERFIDTPVKRYSSGMYLRLAFSVAAHLEPDVLVVDEVLAVGDAAFQKKCLGKMGDVTAHGRTVLFVSHNLVALQSLCTRAVWLRAGELMADGPSREVVSRYLSSAQTTCSEQRWENDETAPGNDRIRIRGAFVSGNSADSGTVLSTDVPIVIAFEYWNPAPEASLYLSLTLYNEQGVHLFSAGRMPEDSEVLLAGVYRDECRIPANLLNDGLHRVELEVWGPSELVYRHPEVLVFQVNDSSALRGGWFGKWPGAMRPAVDWRTARIGP